MSETGLTDLAELKAAFALAAPTGSAWSLGRIGDRASFGFPEEEGTIAGAVAIRRIEFAAGRTHARRALAALGVTPGPIPVGADRAPTWPAGFVGSITHTRSLAAAAVAPAATLAGIGLDIEELRPEIEEIALMILTPTERPRLNGLDSAERQRMATLIFSIKEAVFKAHWPLTRQFLEFADVEVTFGPDLGGFIARVRPGAAGALPQAYRGRCATPGRFALAIVACHIVDEDRLGERSLVFPAEPLEVLAHRISGVAPW
jgi:4'-phosphopantetheinyl transferase EntD